MGQRREGGKPNSAGGPGMRLGTKMGHRVVKTHFTDVGAEAL